MPLEIFVCVKQVPDPRYFFKLAVDPQTGSIRRQGIPSILNPLDNYAVETALQLKECHGGEITAVSMGPPEAEEVLYEVMAMGVDRGVLLTDRAFAGADTLATARVLAAAIERLGEFNLIICGRESADGATAQAGVQLAEILDIPHVTWVRSWQLRESDTLLVEREIEHGHALMEMRLPGLITVGEYNEPRLPTALGIVEATEKEIQKWSSWEINLPLASIGLAGSPTQVVEAFPGQPRGRGQGLILADQPVAEAVQVALKRVRELGGI